jgi:hypothetical protein
MSLTEPNWFKESEAVEEAECKDCNSTTDASEFCLDKCKCHTIWMKEQVLDTETKDCLDIVKSELGWDDARPYDKINWRDIQEWCAEKSNR